jgi:hypothetical protein
MNSNIQKIQLTYDQLNDRLHLSFSTNDFLEYNFWITRRAVKGVWDLLQQMISKSTKTQAVELEHAAEQVQKEAQSPEANLYGMRITKRPLGEEPLLLYKFSITPIEDKHVRFRFESQSGKFVEFSGGFQLVFLLTQLISQALPVTDWGLTLS